MMRADIYQAKKSLHDVQVRAKIRAREDRPAFELSRRVGGKRKEVGHLERFIYMRPERLVWRCGARTLEFK